MASYFLPIIYTYLPTYHLCSSWSIRRMHRSLHNGRDQSLATSSAAFQICHPISFLSFSVVILHVSFSLPRFFYLLVPILMLSFCCHHILSLKSGQCSAIWIWCYPPLTEYSFTHEVAGCLSCWAIILSASYADICSGLTFLNVSRCHLPALRSVQQYQRYIAVEDSGFCVIRSSSFLCYF